MKERKHHVLRRVLLIVGAVALSAAVTVSLPAAATPTG